VCLDFVWINQVFHLFPSSASETAGYVYSGSEDEGDPTIAGGTIKDSKEHLGVLLK